MNIKRLRIINFRSIAQFDCELSSGANAFVGINGSGKTTVLDAIKILFSWYMARVRKPKGSGSPIPEQDIRNGAAYCVLEVVLSNGVSWKLCKLSSRHRVAQTEERTELKALTEYVNRSFADDNTELFVSYDVRRGADNIPLRVRKHNKLGIHDVYSEDIKGHTQFNSFFSWFREREDIENEDLRKNGVLLEDKQLQAVRQAVGMAADGYGDIRVRRRSPRCFVVSKHSDDFNINQLSEGEKMYILLVADIARKMAMTHPNAENPLGCEAIICIDEIDLHLHPKWQQQIMSRLKRIFPNTQFIVSTHSPLVISEFNTRGTDSVFAVEDGRVEPITRNYYGAAVDDLMLGALSMTGLRSVAAQERIDQVWQLLREQPAEDITQSEPYMWLSRNIDPGDNIFAEIALQQRLNKLRTKQ